MAGLGGTERAVDGLSPSSRGQLRAIAWLRWRLFVNAFRRKGGKGEVVARVIFYPIFALMALGPMAGAGALGYSAMHDEQPMLLSVLMWVVFAAWIFVTAGMTLQPPDFDLALLLRFPMSFRTYVVTRFFFGLMSPVNVIASLSLATAAVGIGIAQPGMFAWSAVVLAVYALTVILLLRVALVWAERWLAQRRTREIFTALFALFALSIQFVNFYFQRMGSSRHGHHGVSRLRLLQPVVHRLDPVIQLLPPSLAARSIARMNAGHALAAVTSLLGVGAFLALFVAIYAYRLRGELRGENFDEAPVRQRATKLSLEAAASEPGVRSPLAAVIGKELLYLKRAPAMLIGMLTPLVLVALYAQRMRSFSFVLPAALAYAMFSLLPMMYNVLGQDAGGAQLYLLSPTPIRTVFLAKNLVQSAMIVVVMVLAAGMVSYGRPPTAPIAAATAGWVVFVLFANLSFGNYRSLTAPTKIDQGKVSRRNQTSQLSVLLIVGVLFGSLIVGMAAMWSGQYFGYPWAPVVFFLVLAVAAVVVYLRGLSGIGRAMMARRDGLIEVLCKGS